MNAFGQIAKEYIKENKIHQIKIAEKMGIKESGFSLLLSRDNISLDKMQAIANALDCELVIELKPKTKTSE